MPVALFAQQKKERKPGNPLENLPSNIEVLTHFGERADFAPDNKSIAFMTKSFGDAMEIDLKTRNIRCLTCNVPAAAFLRVMHLTNGDFILIGPDHFENINISRSRDNELWYLSKERGSKPVKLGHKMSEGMAISKKSMKIAFSQVHAQAPGTRVVLAGQPGHLLRRLTLHVRARGREGATASGASARASRRSASPTACGRPFGVGLDPRGPLR